MPRIRTIKPEFFTSEDVVSLTPLARLLYIALWCEADREGRFNWRPKTFKLRYLPADKCDVDELCGELVRRGLVVPYGDGHAFIPSFGRHQHVNPREAASQIPAPGEDDFTRADASVTRADASNLDVHVQVGREGKGKEGKEMTTREDASDVFESSFWRQYPRKVGKDAARRAWAAATKRAPPETILAGLARFRWPDDHQFIPHPATWLNGGRWADEPSQAMRVELPPGVAPPNAEIDQWRLRLKTYKPGGFWPPSWGPRPGEAGCEVPPTVLVESGVAA